MVRPHPKVVRVLLLIVIPAVAVLIGGTIWLRGGGSVGTEDAYVKNDIAQIAPEVAGRVAEVLVHDHAQVKQGEALVKLDAEPFRLALISPLLPGLRQVKPRLENLKGLPVIQAASDDCAEDCREHVTWDT